MRPSERGRELVGEVVRPARVRRRHQAQCLCGVDVFLALEQPHLPALGGRRDHVGQPVQHRVGDHASLAGLRLGLEPAITGRVRPPRGEVLRAAPFPGAPLPVHHLHHGALLVDVVVGLHRFPGVGTGLVLLLPTGRCWFPGELRHLVPDRLGQLAQPGVGLPDPAGPPGLVLLLRPVPPVVQRPPAVVEQVVVVQPEVAGPLLLGERARPARIAPQQGAATVLGRDPRDLHRGVAVLVRGVHALDQPVAPGQLPLPPPGRRVQHPGQRITLPPRRRQRRRRAHTVTPHPVRR